MLLGMFMDTLSMMSQRFRSPSGCDGGRVDPICSAVHRADVRVG